MKPLAVVFAALLLFSVVAFLPANALSAITFTNETTITSQNSQFQQLYENGTSSIIALDTNSTGSYFSDSWDGSTLTSDTGILNGTVDPEDFSIQFDGSTQYGQVASNAIFDITTGNFSVWTFINRTADSGGQEDIIRKRAAGSFSAGTTAGYAITIDGSENLDIHLSGGTGTNVNLQSSATISTGVWYAIGLVVDRSGNATMYLYNLSTDTLETQTASVTAISGSWTNTETFTIARNSAGSSNFFPGHYDNLNVLEGGTITEAQFTEFATTGTIDGVTPTSLYDFEEGSGSTAGDSIGTNDLTLNGSPDWSTSVPPPLEIAGTVTVDSHAYISPVDLSRYSLDFDGSTQYAQASANTVYDVAIEDFWMAGMFKRTSDSGGAERILDKRGNIASDAGYSLFIDVNDNIAIQINDGTGQTITLSTHSITTGKWYVWAFSADRDGDGTIFLYDISTDTLHSTSADISARSGSFTNTDTFTVARRAAANTFFFPGHMDNLIPPQTGQTLTQAQFLEFATTGLVDGIGSWYDMNDGMGTTTLVDMGGSNDLAMNGSPTWSSDVADSSTSRPTIYVTGRDSGNSTLVFGKWNLNDGLTEVGITSQSSTLVPLDIAQSTDNLYTAAINGTSYGTLFDVSQTRSFGSYTETSIHTGTSATPAFSVYYDVDTSSVSVELNSAQDTGAAQLVEAGSSLIGDTMNVVIINLDRVGSPTGDATVGTLNSANNIVHSCGTIDVSTISTTATDYAFFCEDGDHTIASGDRIGIKYTGGDASNEILVGSAVSVAGSVGQAFDGSWANFASDRDMRMKIGHASAEVVVYDGSPDTRYYVFESGTSDELRVVKRTGSTSLLATAMDHTAGEPFSVAQLSDHIIIQTATDTYELDISDDSIQQLHDNSFLTRYAQTFDIAPAERTFNDNVMYVANATFATNYTPSSGSNSRTGVFIDTVNTGGSGTIESYNPSKYYYLSQNDLTVQATSASDTSWEIDDVGTKEQVQITGYTEAVGINLLENTTAILALDVVNLNCDNGNYLIEIQYFAVGSDADCNEWLTFDVEGNPAARHLPYVTPGEIVHASLYDYYTVELSVSDPTIYTLTTIYNAKDADSGNFDSSGQLQQRLLYQNCYVMQVTETTSGNVLQTGNICAGDISTLPISLSGIVIPENWLRGQTWSYVIQRDFDNSTNPNANSTNNHILFTFEKEQTPYDANVLVTDNFENATFSQWYNFTDVTGTSVINQTGINSNQTIYFQIFEDGEQVLTAVSSGSVSGDFSDDFSDPLNNLGLLFGLPVAIIFPVLIAAVFPKSQAHFGLIVSGAVIGIMNVWGFFPGLLGPGFWAVAIVLIAIGVVMARR